VSDKVKKLIWANEYVDFAILLNSSITQANDHYTFRVEKDDGGKPTLTLAPNPKRQSVHSIEQWVSAFQVFVAIYAEKAPHDTPALMKYGSVIRELATQEQIGSSTTRTFVVLDRAKGHHGTRFTLSYG